MLVEFTIGDTYTLYSGEHESRNEALIAAIRQYSFPPNVDLTGTDLRGLSINGVPIPFIDDIDAKILAQVTANPESFDMAYWHNDCNTTPGSLIYAASRPGVSLPNFYVENDAALADLRRCANK